MRGSELFGRSGGSGGGSSSFETQKSSGFMGPYANETFPLPLRTNQVNTTLASLTRGYSSIANISYTMGFMRIMFMNTVKREDLVRLGIYSNAEDYGGIHTLLAKTAQFHPEPNKIITVPLQTPLPIVGGKLYYPAFSLVSTAPGNTFFPAFTLGDTLTNEPQVQLADSGNEMPNTIGDSFYSPNRVWIGWTSIA